MALLSKNPNVNPETGAPDAEMVVKDITKNKKLLSDISSASASPKGSPAVEPTFMDAVNQRMQPDLTQGGPIDMRVSPVTGAPSPRLGEAPARPFLDTAKQPSPDLTQGGPIDMRVSPVTGAPSPRLGETPAPAVDADRAAMLFAKTHGSTFDPKSSADKKKMASITSLMGQEGSEALTPNQFALKIYRTTKK